MELGGASKKEMTSYGRSILADEETRQAAEALAAGSLESQTQVVRSRTIPWMNYKRAELIQDEHLEFIQNYDAGDAARRIEFLQNDGRQLADIFLSLLANISNGDTLKYILTLVDDALSAEPSFLQAMHAAGGTESTHYRTLLRTTMRDDTYIQNKGIKILTGLIGSGPQLDVESSHCYFKWLASHISSGEPHVIQAVMSSLMSLLRRNVYREVFYNHTTGVEGLRELLTKRTANFQLQYQTVFVLWLLTFHPDISATIAPRHHITSLIADILTKSSKEKVVRVCVATLRNLLETPADNRANAGFMVANALPKTCRNLSNKNWKDEDIVTDLEAVNTALDTFVADMSSWDEYVAEVTTGELRWSAMHRAEGFWRDNAMRFNDNDHEILRMVVHLLCTSASPLVLAVAAHDVGEYVSHYQYGRVYVEELGGKAAMLRMMEREDTTVRYEALLAIQKLMVHNWNFMQQQSPVNAGK